MKFYIHHLLLGFNGVFTSKKCIFVYDKYIEYVNTPNKLSFLILTKNSTLLEISTVPGSSETRKQSNSLIMNPTYNEHPYYEQKCKS